MFIGIAYDADGGLVSVETRWLSTACRAGSVCFDFVLGSACFMVV
jgi:hypothetical protein